MSKPTTCTRCGTQHWSTQPCAKGGPVVYEPQQKRVGAVRVSEESGRDAVLDALREEVAELRKRLVALERWREASTAERAEARRVTRNAETVTDPVTPVTENVTRNAKSNAERQKAFRAKKKGTK